MRNIVKPILVFPIRAGLRLANCIWLLCVLAIVGAVSIASAQTNIDIGTTVKQSGAKRFGINLANQNFYDSGMMLRNLIFRNPGFEGQTWTTILVCAKVTTTSCQDSNPYTVWPTNYMKDATYTFMTGAAAGQSGTVTSQDAASWQAGYGTTLHYAAPGTQPNAGDIIQLRTATVTGDATLTTVLGSSASPGAASNGWWLQNVSGGATASSDDTAADQAPGTTGTQCLKVNASGGGQSLNVVQNVDTTAGRSFLQLNGVYTITFKAKLLAGSNQMNVSVQRQGTNGGTYLNQSVNLTNSWADYSYSFNTSETGSAQGDIVVSLGFSGSSVLLDDVQMSADKNVYGTAYRDDVVSTLLTLKPGVLRYMDTAQGMGTSFDNMLKDQFGRQRAGWSTQAIQIDTVPVGLSDFLRLCQAVGAEPWWTMPAATNATEIAHIMEYMAGSSSTHYGAIRAAQGQSAPWTTVFSVIHLELGNEVWNGGSFSGETISAPDLYGKWAGTVFGAAKATSYYAGNTSRFDFIAGMQEVSDFGTQYLLDNCGGQCDTVAVAPYIFGTLGDTSSTEAIFGPLMAEAQFLDGPVSSASNNTSNHMYHQAQVASGQSVVDAYGTIHPAPNGVAVYEVNLSTQQGTATQAQVNSSAAGTGAGVSTINHMLMMLRDLGVKTQSMFALTEYENGFNGGGGASTTPLWGALIDIGVTNLKRPQFLAEQLVNTAILPTVLATKQTGDNPTWNQTLSQNDSVQLNNVQYLQSYAFTDGTTNNLVMINLHRTASLAVTFTGANAPSGNINVSQLTSANITDINETSPNVSITYSNVPNLDPTKSYSLPPFSVTVFSPGSVLPASNTALTANPTTINTGQSVSLSVVVTSSGTNTPSGTVTFKDGTTSLGTATLDNTGKATFSASALVAGSHSITATYGGDSTDSRSVSQAVTVTVTGPATVATTTTLSASGTTATTGQSLTFTANVTPQSGTVTPTGTVTFKDGTATLGSSPLSAGVATFSTSTLAAGTHTIKASYGGDTTNGASSSSAITVTITQAVTTTTVSLTYTPSNPTTVSNVVLSAMVKPKSGSVVPTGKVTFKNGSTVMGTATVGSTGTATYDAGTLWAGTYNLTASYAGDSANSSATSSPVSMVVALATTTTTLAASATTASPGQSISFTATVAGGINAGGTVTFKDGATILGTGALVGGTSASFTTSALSGGAHSITASYNGDTQNAASTSAPVAVTIQQTVTPTTTALTSSATTVTAGQSISFTATVTPQTGTGVPTGAVTFSDGGKTVGTVNVSGKGVAVFSTSALTAGSHSIAASYGGDTKDASSASSAITVTVSPLALATTTSLAASPTTATTGQTITFTSVVARQSGSVVPTGTVRFVDGSTVLGTATVNASGVATFSTATLVAGTHTTTAVYSGDASDAGSGSSGVVLTITQAMAATTTVVKTSASTIQTNQSVTLSATVAASSATAGPPAPTGTVSFMDGSTTLATITLSAGSASFATGSLAVGTHTITASYSGDTKYSVSSSSTVITVSQAVASTATGLLATPTTVSTSQNVALTATVTLKSGTGTPTGTVTFLDGGTSIGSASLGAGGIASFSTVNLAAGTHTITAAYGGDTKDAASVSPATIVTVSQAISATTTGLTASAATATTGQSVTFNATVAPKSGSNVASGMVTFSDGTTALGTGTLNASGMAAFSTTALTTGTHAITASYAGDAKDAASASSAVSVSIAQTIAATVTTLSLSAVQSVVGQSVQMQVAVAAQSGHGVPTGSIIFYSGQTALHTSTLGSGKASFSTSALAAGTYSITAAYSGDQSDSASVSPAVSLTVADSPDYVLSLNVDNVSVATGQSSNATVTITPVNGYSQTVQLSCSGLPSGATCSFAPSSVTPSGGANVSSTVTISMKTAALAVPPLAPLNGVSYGMLMPWGLISLLGLGARSKRPRLGSWTAKLAVAGVLLGASLAMTGCGFSIASAAKTQSQVATVDYIVTITGAATDTLTHAQVITLKVTQ